MPMQSIHPLTVDQISHSIEATVSAYLGKRWKVSEFRDMNEFSSHPAAILSDGSFSVFAKFSAAGNSGEQFEIELAGMRLLSERSGVVTPTPIAIVQVEAGSILMLEAVTTVERR